LTFLPSSNEKEESLKSGIANATAAAGAAAGAESPRLPTGEISLAEQVQKLVAEKQELTETLVRRQADFENYRKRIEKERHQDRHRGVESFVEQLLPVLDAFERALAAHEEPAYAEYRKGFELIHRQLSDALAKQGLERIESAGKNFDPHYHHAIEAVETTEHPDGTVVEVLQPGYVFHGRILRPAMVRVAAHPATAGKKEKARG
jgi:molecular chaperone GrpE